MNDHFTDEDIKQLAPEAFKTRANTYGMVDSTDFQIDDPRFQLLLTTRKELKEARERLGSRIPVDHLKRLQAGELDAQLEDAALHLDAAQWPDLARYVRGAKELLKPEPQEPTLAGSDSPLLKSNSAPDAAFDLWIQADPDATMLEVMWAKIGWDANKATLTARISELEGALNRIASWTEGETVTSSFDEPGSAKIAREALHK